MKVRVIVVAALAAALTTTAFAQTGDPQDQPSGRTGRRGIGAWAGRGTVGTVTEVAPDHFLIKNEQGETWTIHFSVNTRIMKQPAAPKGASQDAPRQMPESIKPTEIKVGDVIAAGGEIDAAHKSVGAMFVMLIDPESAKQMREMQANFGKTWIMGRVTAINDATVTLHSGVDNADHTFTADENTTFRKRRDPITLADMQVGDNVRAEGAIKEGKFVASSVNVMMPQTRGGPAPHVGEPAR